MREREKDQFMQSGSDQSKNTQINGTVWLWGKIHFINYKNNNNDKSFECDLQNAQQKILLILFSLKKHFIYRYFVIGVICNCTEELNFKAVFSDSWEI